MLQILTVNLFTPREVADFFMLTNTNQTKNQNKRQHVFEQLSRNPQNAVFLTDTKHSKLK